MLSRFLVMTILRITLVSGFVPYFCVINFQRSAMSVDDDESLEGRDGNVINATYPLPILTRRIVFSQIVGTFLVYSNQALAGELTDSVISNEPNECKNGGLVTESSVPGAYQQQCMDLDSRTFLLETTDDKIVIEQGASSNRGVAGRTGVWNSGIILTRLLDKVNQVDPTFLKDATVVELGCGVGLASIAAAKLGALLVIATDNNPEVLNLAQKNIEQNAVSNAKTAVLQWGLFDALDYDSSADVIIGSDLTYNPNTWRSLAESMVTILKPGGIIVYLSLGHSGFNVAGELDGFTSVAKSLGLHQMINNSMEKMLPQILNPEEKIVIDANGGARVLLFTKR